MNDSPLPNAAECPNKSRHTACPTGYNSWWTWVRQKARRHKVVKCPGCGRYSIWVRRAKDEPDYGGNAQAYDTDRIDVVKETIVA